jgi:hypothetical protein
MKEEQRANEGEDIENTISAIEKELKEEELK